MMENNMTKSDRAINFIIGFVLLILAIICVYPMIYVIFASFSSPLPLTQHTGLLFHPLEPTIKGYEVALRYNNIWSGYRNTVFVVACGTAINMFVTILAAYTLSRKELYLRKALNLFCLFTMFFSGGLIPTFLVVKNIGLIDNIFALILPVAVNTWNLIILRTAMKGLPKSLEESARIDGASDISVLFFIIIPVIKATLAVLTLYYLVSHWNSWFNAMLYLKDREKFPLQLILREILISNTSNAASSASASMEGIDRYKTLVKYCTTVIATLPILFIYPFLQKYFVKGVLIGSVKG
ncbi:MAG: carbohydrate ABC transporter permease [Oscillospiraceae bacterium]|nr:carbohydrate ABC transporter permease [Oscillospiraceae bacterium]